MRMIRNTIFAMCLDYKVSMSINPVLTVLLTASTVFCALAVLSMFGI